MKKIASSIKSHTATTAALSSVALVAFAGNSILCRLALGAAGIDPASYTAVRLVSGTLTLWLVGNVRGTRRPSSDSIRNWIAGALLFLYATAFAYAYRSLSAGTGALILFASVQLTMIATAIRAGERPLAFVWCGWLLAAAGLVYLVIPGIAAPSIAGSTLMIIAGVAWGAYSLLGRGSGNPVQATTDNFLRAIPWVSILIISQSSSFTVTPIGLIWAVLSGTLTSALGYVIWYAALARMTSTTAATVQLSVPVIAAFGGVAFLSEDLTVRMVIAAIAILGGIGLSLLTRNVARKGSRSNRLAATGFGRYPWPR